MQTAVIARMRT